MWHQNNKFVFSHTNNIVIILSPAETILNSRLSVNFYANVEKERFREVKRV